MYNTYATRTFADLKQVNSGTQTLIAAVLGGLVPSLFGDVGFTMMMYFFVFLMFFMAFWAASGKLRYKPLGVELVLTQEVLRLNSKDKEAVEVSLNEVAPRYILKSYRPYGILPKQAYIHLLLEGGPLGPHEFFFLHNGEYATRQWEKLGLAQIEPTEVSKSMV